MGIDSCNSTSYFATTPFLSLALHSASVVEIPTHVFGAYIIMFKTPSQMGSVKWPMMNLHMSSSLLDIFWGLLTNPFITFPVLAGNGIGILSMLDVDTGIQVYLAVSMIAVVGVSMVAFYENRYHVLARKRNIWSKIRLPALILNYILAVTFMIPHLFLVPNQDHAVSVFKEAIPCFGFYAPNVRIYVFTLKSLGVTITIMGFLVIELIFILFFIALILKVLAEQKANKSVSEHTLVLHRKFLNCLMIQISIPIVMMVIPLFYFAYSIFFLYHNQVLNNLAFLAIALHGFLSTVVTLLVHKPYRNATFRILGSLKRYEDSG